MDNGIKSYTLDCGCHFEYKKNQGCVAYELTKVCSEHEGTPLSSGVVSPHGKLPPNPFLAKPQAGDVTHRVTIEPGDDDARALAMVLLAQYPNVSYDDAKAFAIKCKLAGERDVQRMEIDALEVTQPIPPLYTNAVASDLDRLKDLIKQHHDARSEINALLNRMGSKAFLLFPRIELGMKADER